MVMGDPSSSLSFSEQLTHALRVHSLKSLSVAVAEASVGRFAPRWWRHNAPWYAGRLLGTFGIDDVTVDGARFRVPGGPNETLFKGALWLERYEVLERHAIGRWLPRDLPVVELGASIGVVACLVNRHISEPARHVCVEANPHAIPLLEGNRDRNSCQFRVIHAALAYGTDSIEFGVSNSIVESSLDSRDGAQRVVVPAVRLRQIIDDAGFDRCSLVCDIEGAEQSLVDHESDVLRERIHCMILEVHPASLGSAAVDRLSERLREIGLRTVWTRGNVWVLTKGDQQVHDSSDPSHIPVL